MNKEGMKAAREFLRRINLDGIEKLLDQFAYHEEYINYISYYDIVQDEEEDE